ncbi:hypothetical protein Ocin01_15630 [Orchesella cincta]|uniref:Uncharacterized protein n=1 Tax=Orchesella cincta TaxID=48709 RepID=A0A1D2MDK1_ORCCI|nr:hypothetical protein Ocin01_15630 [Orchesella cincta]
MECPTTICKECQKKNRVSAIVYAETPFLKLAMPEHCARKLNHALFLCEKRSYPQTGLFFLRENAFTADSKAADSLSLGAYENDPSVGKYVNQDGLQQLRHYLKVGPYKSFLGGQPKNAFFGYLRQVIKSKRNIDPNDYAAESLRALKISADARLSNDTNSTSNKRNRKRSRDFVLPATSNKNSYNHNNTFSAHSEVLAAQDTPDCPHKTNICSNTSHPLPKPERGDVLGKVKFVITTNNKQLYTGAVLTRRPVTLIHSTKGHDASNIANVHYSPSPEHEEHAAPGVDHSPHSPHPPRGFPLSGGPKGKGFFGPPLKTPGYGITFTKKFGVRIRHAPAAESEADIESDEHHS